MNYDKYSYQSITFELRTGRNVCQFCVFIDTLVKTKVILKRFGKFKVKFLSYD